MNELMKQESTRVARLRTELEGLQHQELCTQMTRYVMRHGTLSDGFEKIGDSDRYFQCLHELWTRVNSYEQEELRLDFARSELMEAEEGLLEAKKPSEHLKWVTVRRRAELTIRNTQFQLGELARGIDEFERIKQELAPAVRAQYPGGIEQAEKDHWTRVARFRSLMRQLGDKQNLTHVPLAQEDKARLAIETQQFDLAAWLLIDKGSEIQDKYGGNHEKFLEERLGIKMPQRAPIPRIG